MGTGEIGVTGSSRARGSFILASACALVALSIPVRSALAQAQEDRLLTFRLNSEVDWDSNVFRVPGNVADPQLAQGIPGKSDRFTTTLAGLQFNKAYAQQRFLFDVNETAVRYDKFALLNRDSFAYRGEWRWQLSPRIGGVLSTDHSQAPIPFQDTAGNLQRNIATTTNRNFTVDGWLFGGWHLLGGIAELERINSSAFQGLPSIDQTTTEVGFKYVAASQSSITATRRFTRGTNVGQAVDNTVLFIDSEFRMEETELRATWIVSGKSTLNGRLTRMERRNPNVPVRDFSGTSRELVYVWMPTGRLTLNASAIRAVLPFALDTSATYRIDNTITIEPAWQVSEKVSLNMRIARLQSDYLGPVIPIAGPLRSDAVRSLQFAAKWSPYRNLAIGATLRRELRTSNGPGFGYGDTFAGANATLTF